jgi:hypothetical protein
MYSETPFFHHYAPVSSYEGYEVTPAAEAVTFTPDKLDPSKPVYPLPAMRTAADKVAFQKALESNMPTLPQTCQSPPELKASNIFTKAEDLAKATGSDQVCVKSSANEATMNSTSMSASGQVSTWVADASFAMGAQHSESANKQSNFQSGCGASLTNASNILMKESQMQCVINNVSQSTSASANISAAVSIRTQPRTVQENDALAALQSKNSDNMLKLRTTYAQLIQGAILAKAEPASLQILSDFQGKVLALADAANTRSEDAYSRDLVLKKVTVKQTGSVTMKLSVQLSTSAQASLTNLAQSVAKDVTTQALANTFGTSVLDPNVKQASSSATEKNSAAASSSISNITSNTKLNVSMSGAIEISCPGKLTLEDVTIDQNFVASVIANAVMNQAVTNGLSAASSFLSDTANTQSVANKVAGIDDLQKALNAGIKGAIDAGNAPVVASIAASSTNKIIGAVITLGVLFLIYKLFFGGGGKDGGGGSGVVVVQR